MRPILRNACTDQGKQRKTAATHQMLMSAGWTGRKTEDNPQAVRTIASFPNDTDLQLNQHITHLDSSSFTDGTRDDSTFDRGLASRLSAVLSPIWLRQFGTKLPLKRSGVHKLRLVRACVACGLAVLAEIPAVHATVLMFTASVC